MALRLIPTGSQAMRTRGRRLAAQSMAAARRGSLSALDRENGTIYLPVGTRARLPEKMREGVNAYTISVVALDAKAGALKWWYQLRANDDHDWDANNVSLFFDAGGRKLVATSGKQGSLHSSTAPTASSCSSCRDDDAQPGRADHARRLRVCPVAGVQWRRRRAQSGDRLLYINAIDWCTTFKLGKEPTWEATCRTRASRTAGGRTTRPVTGALDQRRSIRAQGTMAWRIRSRRRCTPPSHRERGQRAVHWHLEGDFLALERCRRQGALPFKHGGPIAGCVVTWQQQGKQYVAVALGTAAARSGVGQHDDRVFRSVAAILLDRGRQPLRELGAER